MYKKLVRESCIRNLYIQVAHRTIQVSRMGNMADDRDDDLAVAIVFPALNDQITQLNSTQQTIYKKGKKIVKMGKLTAVDCTA